jgi:hypothetical protein
VGNLVSVACSWRETSSGPPHVRSRTALHLDLEVLPQHGTLDSWQPLCFLHVYLGFKSLPENPGVRSYREQGQYWPRDDRPIDA